MAFYIAEAEGSCRLIYHSFPRTCLPDAVAMGTALYKRSSA